MIDEKLIAVGIVLLYYIIGGVINGLMHRLDPRTFTCDSLAVGLTVMAWIIVVPLYFFALFCDRCIYWFDKKENK